MKQVTRRKKILFGFVTVLFGLAVGAILGEVALRIGGPKWLRQYMKGTNLDGTIHEGSDAGWPIETINHKFVRFKSKQEFPVDYNEYHTIVHTDEWGGRAVKGSENRGRMLVPVLGDSFTFGLGVQDQESFVSLLNTRKDFAFLNLGVPGSCLPNQLDIIEFRHSELGSPKFYVITFYVGNDYTDIMKYYGYGSGSEQSEDSSGTGLSGIMDVLCNRTFLGRSYLFQVIRMGLLSGEEEPGIQRRGSKKTWSFKTVRGTRIANSVYLMMSDSAEYQKVVQKYLQESLQRLKRLARDLRFKPIFIVIPDKHQVDPVLLEKQAKHYGLAAEKLDISLPDRFLENNLEKNQIVYIDTLPCLQGRTGLYYVVDDHLTAEGHQVVARCVADKLYQDISEHSKDDQQ